MTFGQLIAESRKKINMSQKELASNIKKEDGQAISPQYLNDLEHNRRNPTSDLLMGQFAKVLKIDLNLLCHLAGKLPKDLRDVDADSDRLEAAYTAFRTALRTKR